MRKKRKRAELYRGFRFFLWVFALGRLRIARRGVIMGVE